MIKTHSIKEGQKLAIFDEVLQVTIDVYVESINDTKRHRGAELIISEGSSVENVNLDFSNSKYPLDWTLEIGITRSIDENTGLLKQHPSNRVNLYCDYDKYRYSIKRE